jgi:hypothetical protein
MSKRGESQEEEEEEEEHLVVQGFPLVSIQFIVLLHLAFNPKNVNSITSLQEEYMNKTISWFQRTFRVRVYKNI